MPDLRTFVLQSHSNLNAHRIPETLPNELGRVKHEKGDRAIGKCHIERQEEYLQIAAPLSTDLRVLGRSHPRTWCVEV